MHRHLTLMETVVTWVVLMIDIMTSSFSFVFCESNAARFAMSF